VVSPGGVRCVWLRHDVGNHRTSGSKPSIAKSTQEGLVLTEAELVALEKAKKPRRSPMASSKARRFLVGRFHCLPARAPWNSFGWIIATGKKTFPTERG
jgi:hypothetical protein